MNNSEAYDRCAGVVTAEMFADAAHVMIFEAIEHMRSLEREATATILKTYFLGEGLLDELGGSSYLLELSIGAAGIHDARDYAQLVAELHWRRQLIDYGAKLVDEAYRSGIQRPTVPQVIGDHMAVLENALASSQEDATRGQSFAQSSAGLLARMESGEALEGVETSLTAIDKKVNKFFQGRVIVVAGRPGMGKTTFLTTIARNVAMKGGKVAFVTLEMGEEELTANMVGGEADIDRDKIMLGGLDMEELQRFREATDKIGALPIDFLFSDELDVIERLAPELRFRHKRSPYSMVIIDYLQLMNSSYARATKTNRVGELGEITKRLKRLARSMGVPVVVASQLSRAVEQRDDKRPHLADLRDSGTIEQDADLVLMLYREEYYLEQKDPGFAKAEEHQNWLDEMKDVEGKLDVIVSKNRFGKTGTVSIGFDGARSRVFNRGHDGYDDYPDY